MAKKSRCGGCPLFSMCLGNPTDIFPSYGVSFCPYCLEVMYNYKVIDVRELCKELYDEFIDRGFVAACLRNPTCIKEANTKPNKFTYHKPPKLKFKERPNAKQS